MIDFGKSRTIYGIRWPEVKLALDNLTPADYYQGFSDRKAIKERIDDTASMLRDWLAPIISLDQLRFSYPTSGTHHAIEQWLASESRDVCCLAGEYPYPRFLKRDIVIVNEVRDIPINAVVYMSLPFSATGKFDPRYMQIKNQMVLDLAYVGTTALHNLELRPNVEQAFWSASKTFGLGNFRTGYKFTRCPDELQDQIKDTGYFNTLGIDVLRSAISLLSVTDAWDRVSQNYLKLCQDNSLSPSDTYLIATSNDDAFRYLMREDGTMRIPTGKILETIHGLG